MPIYMDAQCYLCHFKRNVEAAQSMGDAQTATRFARELMKLYLEESGEVSALCFSPRVEELFRKYYGVEGDRFREEKTASNRFVLERLDTLRQRIEASGDPLYTALSYALLGNYIDFSALHNEVSFEKLDVMLESPQQMQVDRGSFDDLCRELARAKTLLYLTDNAGEIGFDRLFAEQIHKAYPQVAITFCVRGGPAANDATRADAEAVGIPFPVIDNGNTIPGTYLPALSREAKQALDRADVVISKGQANVETLYGSGYPIFFAFLVKCQRFIEEFGRPKLSPMLLREGKR